MFGFGKLDFEARIEMGMCNSYFNHLVGGSYICIPISSKNGNDSKPNPDSLLIFKFHFDYDFNGTSNILVNIDILISITILISIPIVNQMHPQ